MKNSLLMPCLVVVGLVVVGLLVAGVEAGTLVVLAVAVACPLMMLVMMGGMFGMARRHIGGHTSDGPRQEDEAARS